MSTPPVSAAETSVDLSMANLATSGDLVSNLVLLILGIISIWSWAIIITKFIQYRQVLKKISQFEQSFWTNSDLKQLMAKIDQGSTEPLGSIFQQSIAECHQNVGVAPARINYVKERIHSLMLLHKNRYLASLENHLSFLATAASAAPFIGLFGTVWGIMNSFRAIASAQNTSLAIVAPGIAEALFATAVGLGVAIPATILYNYLAGRLTIIEDKITHFSAELMLLLAKAIEGESTNNQ